MNPVLSIFVCLILSAFFSGMEIAFISANRLIIELDRKQGLFSARIISIFTRKPAEFIATMLIANNIVLVIYGIIIAKKLEPFIFQFINHAFYVLIIQTIISTLIILLSAEFLPKVIFRLKPNFFLNYLSIPVFLFYIVLYPVTISVIWLSHNFLHWFVKKKNEKESDKYVFGKVDLDHLVQNIGKTRKHTLDTDQEIRIFQNALDFSNVKLRDCMVPRPDVVAVDSSCTVEELKAKFIDSGFSKILIYEGSIDNIIGYVNSKELFKNPRNIKSKIVRASIVPETMNANKLLRLLLQEHKSLAVVVDEFGGTSGIVTTEDIMEEIFGEIEDEHDTNEIVEKVLSEDSFIFSGKLQIDYLNENYKIEISESDEYDTLAGYILFNIGRIPILNEQVVIGKHRFKILKTIHKKLDLIYLKLGEE